MFGKRYELFRVAGIPIGIDASWVAIAALLSWSLATGVFPALRPGLEPATYWGMGVVGALGLFLSVVLHELGHALEARRHDVHVRAITLFIFGGVAEMTDEPPTPTAELRVAIAGPIVSLVLGVAFLAAAMLGAGALPVAPATVLAYLGVINLTLVAFNLVPAFPLDGGRVLRSILWRWKRDLRWATRVTSQIGAGFGMLLVFLGVLELVRGDFIGGLWWILIGLFLRNAAQMSYQQLLVRRMLEGEPVRRFMSTDPVTVPRALSVRELVENYVFRLQHAMFPVVDEGRLVGCVSTAEVKAVPREEWDRQSVGAIARPCDADNSISPDADAVEALRRMSQGRRRLLVVDQGRLVGVLSLADLLRLFSLRMELGDGQT